MELPPRIDECVVKPVHDSVGEWCDYCGFWAPRAVIVLQTEHGPSIEICKKHLREAIGRLCRKS